MKICEIDFKPIVNDFPSTLNNVSKNQNLEKNHVKCYTPFVFTALQLIGEYLIRSKYTGSVQSSKLETIDRILFCLVLWSQLEVGIGIGSSRTNSLYSRGDRSAYGSVTEKRSSCSPFDLSRPVRIPDEPLDLDLIWI